jgi:AraC-like DNA-binding protein
MLGDYRESATRLEWLVWYIHVKSGMPPESERYVVFDTSSHSPIGQIKMAGVLRNSSGISSPRVFGYYALVYVTGGRGFFSDQNGFSAPLSPGNLIVIFPDVAHTYGPVDSAPWDETFVVFEGKAFDLWRAEGLLNPQKPLHLLEPPEHWHQRIISAVWSDPSPGTDFALARTCRLQHLLADILTFENRRNGTATSWLSGVTRQLEDAVDTPPDYEKIAEDQGMTYEGFRKRFAREAGISPGRYVAQLRMQRACEMMTGRTVAVKDVARNLGFFDEFHFSRQFKKAIGMTPKDFSRLFR